MSETFLNKAQLSGLTKDARRTEILRARGINELDARVAALEAGGGGGGPTMMEVAWHSDGSAAMALTNSPLAERFALGQPARIIKLIPLNSHTEVRIVGNQVTTSASVNTPRVRLLYKTGAYSATIGTYASLALAGDVGFTLTGTGYRDSGWVAMAAGATGDIFVGLTELGGDGVADPALGHVNVFFR